MASPKVLQIPVMFGPRFTSIDFTSLCLRVCMPLWPPRLQCSSSSEGFQVMFMCSKEKA